jgi:hypothetical protein
MANFRGAFSSRRDTGFLTNQRRRENYPQISQIFTESMFYSFNSNHLRESVTA